MAEQATRRAPGRPKKAETKANVPPMPTTVKPVAKPKKPSIKRKETVNQNKEYEIPRNGGVVYMLPQKGVTVTTSLTIPLERFDTALTSHLSMSMSKAITPDVRLCFSMRVEFLFPRTSQT